jgi:DNA-binding MarR family transcriptional regulator
MRDRNAFLTEIADALPEIMRRLIEGRPVSSGEWELTLAQARALRAVADRGGCTMGQLARSLGISLSTATELVDRLVQHRHVERTADPNDRRLVLLRPAPAAKRAHQAFVRKKRRRMEEALHHLSLGELKQIADSLALLRNALGGEGMRGKEPK